MIEWKERETEVEVVGPFNLQVFGNLHILEQNFERNLTNIARCLRCAIYKWKWSNRFIFRFVLLPRFTISHQGRTSLTQQQCLLLPNTRVCSSFRSHHLWLPLSLSLSYSPLWLFVHSNNTVGHYCEGVFVPIGQKPKENKRKDTRDSASSNKIIDRVV